ncbi:cytochrome P450 [Auricularia subglabra TFB-10046 SS5]|nr:cytochrome P450 [Auricularia subglabra TFB-10046 SS5]
MTVLSREPLLLLSNPSWVQFGLVAAAVYGAYLVASFAYAYWRHTRSPLRKLPGPREGASWLTGHQGLMFEGENMQIQEGWLEKYGGTFSTRGALGRYELITSDTRAMTHILFATHVFQKPISDRVGLKTIIGHSMLSAEGEEHRDQRRILNPAFGHAHVREMMDTFLDVSTQMTEIWQNKCLAGGGSAQVDVLSWLSRATLDALGKAGFDYDFNSLSEADEKNELAEALDGIMRVDVTSAMHVKTLLNNMFPVIRKLFPDERARRFDHSRQKMFEIGMGIVQEKKRVILSELAGTGRIDKKAVGGKDVMSLLLQANLAHDLEPSQRLSDAEAVSQIPLFVVAGHETTSNSTTWAMYALATFPEMQKNLREELQQVGTDRPTLEMLNALPYLDKIVRETLRLHMVVAFQPREAFQDDVIPLSKPITDVDGNVLTQLRVQKGDQIQLPIWAINRSKDIWGPDADQFRPDRWDNLPEAASTIPGISPNLMSFIGGPRGCIGHRFAVAEMKALLFHIVRGFEFRFAVDRAQLWTRTGGLLRVQLRSDNTVQLPMVITPVA